MSTGDSILGKPIQDPVDGTLGDLQLQDLRPLEEGLSETANPSPIPNPPVSLSPDSSDATDGSAALHNKHDHVQLATLNLLHGWRLWVNMACLALGLFLSSLETTIIATSLVSISSDLGSFDKSNWIVTSYLLTYTGFLVIFARISDLFGRKGTVLVSMIMFTIFSTACGVSQTMEQLIVFRALQGMGGAGLYSMAVSVITEITPLQYIGVSSGLLGSIFAMSSLLGPTIGGAITSHTTWRWVFWLNIPPGVIAAVLLAVIFPRNARPMVITRRNFALMDYLGALLYLLGSTMVVFALEEGGIVYAWNSPLVIASFCIGPAAFVGFMGWEWHLSLLWHRKGSILPLFPMYLTKQRIISFSFITAFLAGFPFLVLIVFLPQRFQLMNGLSPVHSGVRMLPLLLLSATGAGLGGIMSKTRNISSHVLLVSLGLQLLGLGLMTTLPTTAEFTSDIYGFEVILGLGFGLTLSCVVIVAQTEVKNDPDVVITISAITQIRVLGGVIGVAMAQAILNQQLTTSLAGKIPSDKIEALLRSASAIRSFTPEELALTVEFYGKGFDLQYKVILGLSGLAFLTGLGCWQMHPASFTEIQKRRPKGERGIPSSST